jgi:hypothetical protein
LSASLKMLPPECRVVKRGREKRISITPTMVSPKIRSLGNETPSPAKIMKIKSATPRNSMSLSKKNKPRTKNETPNRIQLKSKSKAKSKSRRTSKKSKRK